MLEVLLSASNASVLSGTGPGPSRLIGSYTNPENTQLVNGYFGRIFSSDFISSRDLEAALNFTVGTANPETGTWMKFYLDGKILVMPVIPLRKSISYRQLYQAGLAYGVNGPGLAPSGVAVNQYRTVTIAGYVYLVRLPRGLTTNSVLIRSADSGYMEQYPEAINSEFSRTLFNVNKSVRPAVLKTGGTWDTFSDTDLGFTSNAYGYVNWCMEEELTAVGNRLARGGVRGEQGAGALSTTVSIYYSWRPVLELVGKA